MELPRIRPVSFFASLANVRRKNPSQLLVADITEKAVTEFLAHLEGAATTQSKNPQSPPGCHSGLFNSCASGAGLMEHCRRISAIPFKRQNEIPEISYLEKNEVEAMLKAADRTTTWPARSRHLALHVQPPARGFRRRPMLAYPGSVSNRHPKSPSSERGASGVRVPLGKRRRELKHSDCDHAVPGREDRPLFLNRYGQAMTRFGIWDIVQKYRTRAAESVSDSTGQAGDTAYAPAHDRHAPPSIRGGNQCHP